MLIFVNVEYFLSFHWKQTAENAFYKTSSKDDKIIGFFFLPNESQTITIQIAKQGDFLMVAIKVKSNNSISQFIFHSTTYKIK